MKTLYIVRHAKSDRDNVYVEDFERPLNERGANDASLVAEYIAKKGISPDIVIASPALRAMKTAQIFTRILNCPPGKIIQEKNLYYSTMEEMEKVVTGISDEYNSAMIFGHNPTLTDFVNKHSDAMLDYMPTTGFAVINIEGYNWKNVVENKNKLIFFVCPKMLKERKNGVLI
ncbi:MAG: histidine phosphatase family protein [Bacteroidales bacterium]|nr:histidine phosphatase family protein [Bacteroidales bacterium]